MALSDKFIFIEAADQEEAEAKLSEDVDVIVMDWRLGGQNTAPDLLPKAKKKAPVIVATGMTEKTVKEEALALGACSFLLKPFDLNVLSSEIERAAREQGSAQTKARVEAYAQ